MSIWKFHSSLFSSMDRSHTHTHCFPLDFMIVKNKGGPQRPKLSGSAKLFSYKYNRKYPVIWYNIIGHT